MTQVPGTVPGTGFCTVGVTRILYRRRTIDPVYQVLYRVNYICYLQIKHRTIIDEVAE